MIGNRMVKYLFYGSKLMSCWWWSAWCQAAGLAWGVKIGRGCRFFGHARFHHLSGAIMEIGANCTFNSSACSNLLGVMHPCILATLSPEAELRIGDGCGFSGASICAEKSIRIGRQVRVGANTTITDTNWHSDDPRVSPPRPVVIEDGVWLGMRVLVLPGARIGKNSVIGAGSIVTGEIPANCIAAGAPARVLRRLPEEKNNSQKPLEQK